MKKINIASLDNSVDFSGAVCNSAIAGSAVLVIVVIAGYAYSHRAQ